jgi:hypothetical protein
MPSALKDSYEALYKALNDASAADLPLGKPSWKESRMKHLSSFLLSAGFAKRTDRHAAVAVVGGESLIFAANGSHCSLAQLADSLGAEGSSVTDIYLPGWFAHNLPAIHAPLIVLAAFLHGRNLRQQRKHMQQRLAATDWV